MPLVITPFSHHPHPLCSKQPLICSVSTDLTFTNISFGVVHYVVFCVWLLSLSVMFSSSSMLSYVSLLHSFLWLNMIPLYRYIFIPFSKIIWSVGPLQNVSLTDTHASVHTHSQAWGTVTAEGPLIVDAMPIHADSWGLALINICPEGNTSQAITG